MELVKVKSEDRDLLWNLNQKYLYEMTAYYDDELDPFGNLHYGYFDAYFTDPQRKAFFLYDEKTLVGFAMIHPYSQIEESTDHVLAEFTVFPMYRRKHFGILATELLFDTFKGRWEIKYHENNAAAKALWNKVAEPYQPRVIHVNDRETVLSFCTV